MLEREMLNVTKCVGVNSFVEALINMVCELKITSGSKKKLCKNGDPTLRSRVITEKQRYAATKYIVG